MPPDYRSLCAEYPWLRDGLIATERDFVGLDITDDAPEHPWQTQFGGQPYGVDAEDFPRGSDGRPLTFLAQLNFAELPALAGYPTEGLLQFFLGADDIFGISYDATVPSTFHVRYHPVIAPDWQPQTELGAVDEDETPLHRPLTGLFATGTLDRMPLTPGDRRLVPLVGQDVFETTDFGLSSVSSPLGTRIGGYPFIVFAIDDREDDKDLLLLQCDSDGHAMEWGDGGAAQFFISADDLAARDFSRVQYTWNCF